MSKSSVATTNLAGITQGLLASALCPLAAPHLRTWFHGESKWPWYLDDSYVNLYAAVIIVTVIILIHYISSIYKQNKIDDKEIINGLINQVEGFNKERHQLQLQKNELRNEIQDLKLDIEQNSISKALEKLNKERLLDEDSANEHADQFVDRISQKLSDIAFSLALFHMNKAILGFDPDAAYRMSKANNMLQIVIVMSSEGDAANELQSRFDDFHAQLVDQTRAEWQMYKEQPMAENIQIINGGGELVRNLCGLGKFAEAEPIAREVWERRKILDSPDHPNTLIAAAWLRA